MRTTTRNICVLFISVLCHFIAFSHVAQADSGAKQVLQKAVDQVLTELKKPEFHTPSGHPVVIKKIESIVYQLFDFEEFSARTIGASWHSFSPEQKKRFTDAFTGLLRETYIGNLEDYDGGDIVYKGEVSSSDGKRVEIQTTITIKGKDVPIAYRMINKKNWVVYDINVESIGMVQNYRKQFHEILAKGNIESLIALVEKKAKEARENNKKSQLSK